MTMGGSPREVMCMRRVLEASSEALAKLPSAELKKVSGGWEGILNTESSRSSRRWVVDGEW